MQNESKTAYAESSMTYLTSSDANIKITPKKKGLPDLPENLLTKGRSQTWADISDEASDYSEDSEQPETSAGDWAKHSLVELQCLHELQTAHDSLDYETFKIFSTIGWAQQYIDLKFLNRCLPSYYPRNVTRTTPYLATPLSNQTHEDSSVKTPTIFLLTSTNPLTEVQFTQTHEDLSNAGLKVIPLLGIDGEKVPLMRKMPGEELSSAGDKMGFLMQSTIFESPQKCLLTMKFFGGYSQKTPANLSFMKNREPSSH